ncbi:nicotinamide riboside transporter PnuC [Ideonella sp. A 288]|uniref:nicotinamide riboside transporter PnuC n=1 Tax=Ideonella sp. A 288 TaxID=1962181 RepID=UPI000B4BE035|nr:nicotinamide riboside transporter PnuC [Ideonella sp. A 288]
MGDLIGAARPLLAVAFTAWGSPVTWLELVAFGLSLWMVVCNMRVDPLGWPLAMVSSLLYSLLFAASRLYGEAALQWVFIGVAVWGWRQWLEGRHGRGQAVAVGRMSPRERWMALGLTLAAWPLLATALARWTDSDVPWLDALATAGSITGQFMLGRKWIENWAVWLAVNVFSVALFAVKGLWLTTLLYALFAVLSVAGWRAWRAQLGPAHG